MIRTLTLTHFGKDSADVNCTQYTRQQTHDTLIGHVFRNADGTWSARDIHHQNHGDNYTEIWYAAKQLALGLEKGDYVQ